MRYALKKVRNIVGRDIATGKNKFVLSDLKSLTISGSSEVVWSDGADGAHLVGFDTNKVATIEAENGSIDIGYLETQTGGSLRKVENGSDVLFTEVLTVSGGKATTTHKASGVVGGELGFAYPLDATSDPDRLNAFVQAATASATEFAYDPETKEITLPTGKFADGDKVYVEYFPTFGSYEELDNDSDKFSETVAVYCNVWTSVFVIWNRFASLIQMATLSAVLLLVKKLKKCTASSKLLSLTCLQKNPVTSWALVHLRTSLRLFTAV